ncbi:group III truncated hemoglobin [Campylobacter sp. MIT 97-5078]|uniref:group III truncated hemoglobin n=1 Tax=Campylobacter sp. MIT 97-5078 TaxID=1548153 RepID=UPI000513357D|nr:group III truncated hemoglobin [Campylobacter sp. MIT 97-5078]KGI55963.1 Group 3 truncated hemoglobin ctb [Campylobacter sp. MIT 97-5078]KGI57429.1 Group 3 truncated hemoglobin ctb [Campylobacter sp. MIT 97-5078]TQR27352.1 hypothetical protein DMB91_03590 [Campylobacter sp. MIT 97-5078]
MKLNTINKEGIDRLMEIFYEKIRRDKDLGAIFNAKVGTDDEAWQNHKAKISNFWQGMLLGQGNYNGQPMKVHIELPSFPREFFDTWLKLFEKSLNQVFNEEMSMVILQRAQMIARNFQNVLYARR